MLLIVPLFAKAQRIQIIESSATECLEESGATDRLLTRIIESQFSNGILEVRIGTTEACCQTLTPIADYRSGYGPIPDTLNLGYSTNGILCECDCYYELSYKIKGLPNADYNVLFNGGPITYSFEKYRTFPVKFKILEADTINVVDKFGLRRGVWILDSTMVSNHYYFENDIHIRETVLFDNGRVQREIHRDPESGNWSHFVEYFESGERRAECHAVEPHGSYKNGRCKQWNMKLELIYDGTLEGMNIADAGD